LIFQETRREFADARRANMLRVMIDPKELAICKRRGHEEVGLSGRWKKCKWCGMWVRDVRTIEERDSEPPKDEQDPLENLRRSR